MFFEDSCRHEIYFLIIRHLYDWNLLNIHKIIFGFIVFENDSLATFICNLYYVGKFWLAALIEMISFVFIFILNLRFYCSYNQRKGK